MAQFYFAIFISTTGQVYDFSQHFQSIEWIDGDDNSVTVFGKVHNRKGEEAVGHLVGEVHKWQRFTIIYGSSEHAWNNRKARVVMVGVPLNSELEFTGEEWFGAHY
jgi:hypothetical protein